MKTCIFSYWEENIQISIPEMSPPDPIWFVVLVLFMFLIYLTRRMNKMEDRHMALLERVGDVLTDLNESKADKEVDKA